MENRKCSECAFAIAVDEGYSNYTVEGTSIYCAKELNPGCPFDRWYGGDASDAFAQSCESYKNGEPAEVDVDLDALVGEYPRSFEDPAAWVNYATDDVSADDLARVIGQ